MFIVPPASGAKRGPVGPQRLAAARAVPSPATTTSRSGPVSTAALSAFGSSSRSGVRTFPLRPASARIRPAWSAASGSTWPASGLISTSMVRTFAGPAARALPSAKPSPLSMGWSIIGGHLGVSLNR